MLINATKGDITTIHADVIVNAANAKLRGGGGVDGAIHKAAGPELLAFESWMYPHGTYVACPVATPAFNLPAKHIIHVPGPDTRGTEQMLVPDPSLLRRRWERHEARLWASYARSLELANMLGARTVAFPSISTGIYGFPLRQASRIAVNALSLTGERPGMNIVSVVFVAFDDATHGALAAAIGESQR